MVVRKNLHTNITLDNARRERIYQAVITDLAITGIVPRDKAEMLLGYTIPDFLCTPDKKTIAGVKTEVKLEGALGKLTQVGK